MKTMLALAKTDSKVEVLTFDYQQNAPLPKVPAGDAFYLRQLWMFNFYIYSGKYERATFYMYDETQGKKTPNESVSFLHHYIENTLDKNVNILYLFSDNCAAQNKNYTLVNYLYALVRNGRFKKIMHRFPEPGHSFLPCDRCFGVVEKYIRKVERVYLPEEYIHHYNKSSAKFNVVVVRQDMILNFVEHYQPYFKKTITNKHKEKFAISKYRTLIYNCDSNVIICSKTANTIVTEEYSITKVDKVDIAIPLTPKNEAIYSSPLPLKKQKLENVMVLANKYVPEAYLQFYRSLRSEDDPQGNENDSDVTDEDINE